ncbi:MAG TPA: hypothetical protein VNV88_16335 [Candidatus Solibacter sp.]|jgi:hypothetical protein|nr:hypothetical protein [Candidatus Solibacter sp.]
MKRLGYKSGEDKKMNCKQFQDVLPHIIESGGDPEQENHLSTCESCAALVRDLKYIAEQARLLLPMHDPNPRVWKNIEQSLQREGLLEGRMSRQGQTTKYPTIAEPKKNGTLVGWVLALAATAALVVVLMNYHPASVPSLEANANHAAATVQFDGDDQKLLGEVSSRQPDLGRAYEDSLREVNSYIADARKAANENPDDALVQEHLRDAYHQKAVLYEMATVRSLD